MVIIKGEFTALFRGQTGLGRSVINASRKLFGRDREVLVDAAKSLVDVEGVPALIGAISSGVSLPILTSVAVPSKVTQVSCCSTSPTFTKLAKEGKTDGFFFRTYATSVW